MDSVSIFVGDESKAQVYVVMRGSVLQLENIASV